MRFVVCLLAVFLLAIESLKILPILPPPLVFSWFKIAPVMREGEETLQSARAARMLLRVSEPIRLEVGRIWLLSSRIRGGRIVVKMNTDWLRGISLVGRTHEGPSGAMTFSPGGPAAMEIQ